MPVGDRVGGCGVEAAIEHRKLAEQVLLLGRELLVGPVHDRAQGMMAAIGPSSDGKQPEPVPQVPDELTDCGPGQPRGGQFDGERQAVQPGTQRGDRLDVRVLRRGRRVRRAGPVQEQPDRWSAETAHRERPDLPDVLTVNLEPLAAGRQEGDVAGLLQQPLGEDGGSLGDVLTVIQHKQQVPGGQLFDELIVEALERPLAQSGCGGQGPEHGVRFAHRGEVAEADAVAVAAAGPGGHLQRQPGLPHPARPVQGDQPRLPQQPGDGREILVPADKAGHRNRQRRRRVRDLTAGIRCTGRVTQDVLFDPPQGR